MSEAADSRIDNSAPDRRVPLVIRAIDRLTSVFAVFAAAGVVLLVLNILIDVVGRKLFNSPAPGTIEHTAYWWMPMLALLAFAYTEKRQEHIKVTILLDALPLRMRQIIEGFFCLGATLLLVAVAYYTWQDALRSYGFKEVTASSPPVAIWPFKFVAVAGMAMIALQTAATSFRYFAGLLPQSHVYDTEADVG
jgi:TRAP-type mannitol/chloroaromatic compound transport system permease small subunit